MEGWGAIQPVASATPPKIAVALLVDTPPGWRPVPSGAHRPDGEGASRQAIAGTGAQPPIQVNFGSALATVDVTAVDPDFGTNRMEAYAADGTLLGTTYFVGDNNPGVTTTSTRSITDARGIRRIVLISDPADYVAFQGLTAYPIY